MDDLNDRIAKARETINEEQRWLLGWLIDEVVEVSAEDAVDEISAVACAAIRVETKAWKRAIAVLLAYEEERQRMIADIPKHFDDGRRQAHSEIAEAHKKEIDRLRGMRDQRDRAIRERDRARRCAESLAHEKYNIAPSEYPAWVQDALADEEAAK